MKLHLNPAYLSAEMKARIWPLPIPLIKAAMKYMSKCNIINIKMHCNLSAANSETYELKITTFENGQPE